MNLFASIQQWHKKEDLKYAILCLFLSSCCYGFTPYTSPLITTDHKQN